MAERVSANPFAQHPLKTSIRTDPRLVTLVGATEGASATKANESISETIRPPGDHQSLF